MSAPSSFREVAQLKLNEATAMKDLPTNGRPYMRSLREFHKLEDPVRADPYRLRSTVYTSAKHG